MAAALLVTVTLLVAGNVLAAIRATGPDQPSTLSNWLLALAFLGVALVLGVRRPDLGLRLRRPLTSALVGLAAGTVLALPAAIFFLAAPLLLDEAITYEVSSDSAGERALNLTIVFLLGTALPEELLFRGVLHGLWARASGPKLAVVATSVAFALWHLVVILATVEDSGAADNVALLLLGYAGTLAALGSAGLVLGALRIYTGSVVAPTTGHWAAVGVMRLALWTSE